jgi:hypothetical protein
MKSAVKSAVIDYRQTLIVLAPALTLAALTALVLALLNYVYASDDCPSAAYRVQVNATLAPRGVNVRLNPPLDGTLQPVIGSLAVGDVEEARDVRDGWYLLCGGGWVSGAVVIALPYTPTPIAVTPTRAITSTPLAQFIRIWIDVDGNEVYETVIDCQKPCRMRLETNP